MTVAVAVALLGGCAVGGGSGDDAALPDDLAKPAQRLTAQADSSTGASPSSTTAGERGSSTTAPSSASPPPAVRPGPGTSRDPAPTTSGPAPATRSFRRLTEAGDRTGDAGLQARPYGDLVSVVFEDDGVDARVTVTVAGDLPARPADGEVVGVGVDVYRGNETESEHQLFAVGNHSDGWRAWLQQGDDFVAYPGTFAVGGDRLVFTVPWSALGGRRPGSFSAFLDWSRAGVAVVAEESADRAPDGRATQPFSF